MSISDNSPTHYASFRVDETYDGHHRCELCKILIPLRLLSEHMALVHHVIGSENESDVGSESLLSALKNSASFGLRCARELAFGTPNLARSTSSDNVPSDHTKTTDIVEHSSEPVENETEHNALEIPTNPEVIHSVAEPKEELVTTQMESSKEELVKTEDRDLIELKEEENGIAQKECEERNHNENPPNATLKRKGVPKNSMKCPFCSIFVSKKHFLEHCQRKHPAKPCDTGLDANVSQQPCHICGSLMATEQLAHHVQRMHGNEGMNKDNFVVCHICNSRMHVDFYPRHQVRKHNSVSNAVGNASGSCQVTVGMAWAPYNEDMINQWLKDGHIFVNDGFIFHRH